MESNTKAFYPAHPSTSVDKGDILSIFTALIIVSAIALVFRPPVAEAGPEVLEPLAPVGIPTPAVTTPPAPTSLALPDMTRIPYTTGARDYPIWYLPDNLTGYGGSDPLWKETGIVPFAYIHEARGGITRAFHVPYAVWRLNCSVSATVRPEAAHFRMALVELESGTIVEGAELRYPGSIVKTVERGGKDFYLIIGVDAIDSYRITLETLLEYL